jgi:hypothetical protein
MTVDAHPDVIHLGTAQFRLQVRELMARWRAEQRCAPRCDSWLRSYDPALGASRFPHDRRRVRPNRTDAGARSG